ncbi:MAG: aspartate carbamoyltransferase [Treponema sp.]|nr:aspartate carbamoyltransferase [Treponema sp.]MCL2272338.1 aspartate carbamoyltransferase [Treponema sp.]
MPLLPEIKGRSLIEPEDFSLLEMENLFSLAEKIENNKDYLRESCRGRLLASLFFEPSTRTRLSFEAAMLRLGGSCLGFADPGSSSAAKGESLADTIRMAASYADAIVMRSPKEGAALLASRYSEAPVINAGDGGHHHPTQTLTDLLTVRQLLGRIESFTIGFCGDLKFGRTVHSLAKALARYKNIKMIFISPLELVIPEYIKGILKKNNVEFNETESLEKSVGEIDVLYMTRVQRERFFNEDDYIRLKDTYVLNTEKMSAAKEKMIILHPLPRVNEIAVEIDTDPRAAYFKQAKYGMYVRMALLASILGAL